MAKKHNITPKILATDFADSHRLEKKKSNKSVKSVAKKHNITPKILATDFADSHRLEKEIQQICEIRGEKNITLRLKY
ncbi:hypothetical protein [Flavobacterium sp. CLA17]|uniref:hypothetical protein n=1 Tax=Flavobacterium sp. CLA17 TaxID=2724135 RepID=UPI0019684C1E|nr:hypothetical protein [Flavobacterium sp. CLA17]QSB27051.1 hypothetical protein HAV12_022265 [Flavobacterium sp. CLA17]